MNSCRAERVAPGQPGPCRSGCVPQKFARPVRRAAVISLEASVAAWIQHAALALMVFQFAEWKLFSPAAAAPAVRPGSAGVELPVPQEWFACAGVQLDERRLFFGRLDLRVGAGRNRCRVFPCDIGGDVVFPRYRRTSDYWTRFLPDGPNNLTGPVSLQVSTIVRPRRVQ